MRPRTKKEMVSGSKHSTSVFLACLALLVQMTFASSAGKLYEYKPDRNDALTSSGMPFNSSTLSCAHSFLPLGSKVAFSYMGRTVADVVVNDRKGMDRDVFFVTHEVFASLGADHGNVLDVDWTVMEVAEDGADVWGEKGNSWYVARNIRSKDLRSLYKSLVGLGYKPRLEGGNASLMIPYIVEHRWDRLISDLDALGADVAAVIKKEMESSPLRL